VQRLYIVEERGRSVVGVETGDDAVDFGGVAYRAGGENGGEHIKNSAHQVSSRMLIS